MNSTKASPGRNLEIMETYFNSYFQELDSLAQIPVSSVKPLLILTDRSETSTSSSTDNQITVLARIEEIYKIIFELNLTNRVYYCAPKFANILNNLLPRLQVEIERQAELTPAEIRIHYSNVLLLNQYIAEELADIYLTYNGKISLFAGNNHDLHARLVALGYATNLSGLENFCSSGNNIRNVIRYYADQTRFSSISGDVSKAKRHLKASSHSIHSSSTTSTSTVDGFIPVISKQTKMFLEMQKHALDNTLQLANLIELITTMKTH